MKVVDLEFVRRKAKRTGRIVFHGSKSAAWSRHWCWDGSRCVSLQ
nr:hypothetical protein [Tanacetum cinerariifolium]